MILLLRVRILHHEVNLVESSFSPGFEHYRVGNVEDFELMLRSWFDEESEGLKILWWQLGLLVWLGAHPREPVTVRHVNIAEVGNEDIAIWLELFLALFQNVDEHILIVDECGQNI